MVTVISLLLSLVNIFNVVRCFKISDLPTVSNGGLLDGILDQVPEFFQQDAENATKCDVQLQAVLQSLTKGEMWAIQMFDAWGKFPAGILQGNMFEMGNYDECRKVQYDAVSQPEVGTIHGQYCMLSLPFNLGSLSSKRNFPGASMSGKPAITLGACFPEECRADQLTALLNSTNMSLTVTCEVPLANMGAKEIAAIVIFSIVFALLVLSTSYEIISMIMSREPNRNLSMFSIYSNGLKLFNMTARPTYSIERGKSGQIDCLNGIRVISMVWIVFCHNYMVLLMSPTVNLIDIYDWIKSYHSMLVIAGAVSVDSFFLLSGMLVCWSLLKELDRAGKLNLPVMYLHRYLRLTPAFAALILLSVSLMKYFGSGPYWNSTISKTVENNCDKYWWSALLYVQNYVNPKEMCLGHSWYLSVDMQLYVLSPALIYPLWRWGRKVLYAVGVLILLAMGCVIGSFLVNELRVAYVDPGQSADRSRQILTYYPTHTRMGAWLVGVIFGYVLFATKHRRVVMEWWVVTCGWIASLGLIIGILLADYPLQQPDKFTNHPLIVDALYESFNRVIWAGCLGWIVFACVNGYGGPVNTFLSLSIWQPLGRLSYSIYLLHLPVQTMLLASMRHLEYFGDVNAAHRFWGDFGLTVTLSVAWCLAFESPIVGLEKLLLGSLKKSSVSKPAALIEDKSADVPSSSTASLPSTDPV